MKAISYILRQSVPLLDFHATRYLIKRIALLLLLLLLSRQLLSFERMEDVRNKIRAKIFARDSCKS